MDPNVLFGKRPERSRRADAQPWPGSHKHLREGQDHFDTSAEEMAPSQPGDVNFESRGGCHRTITADR